MIHHLKRKSYILICIIVCFSLNSCYKCEPFTVLDGSIKLDLVDSISGNAMLSLSSPLIDKNDVIVISAVGDTLRHYFALINGAGSDREAMYIDVFSYGDSLYTPSFQEEQWKDFRVRLSSSREFNLKTCFLSRGANCGSLFRSIKLFYRGQLIASNSNTIELSALVKN